MRNPSLVALIGVMLVTMTGFAVFLPIFPFLALSTEQPLVEDEDGDERVGAQPTGWLWGWESSHLPQALDGSGLIGRRDRR
jgi:hypothetical protein